MGQSNTTIYIPTNDELLCEWVYSKKLSHGNYGSIKEACCKNDCSYIAKIQTIGDNPGEISEKNFRKEVRIHNYLAKHNVSPPVMRAWIKGNKAVMIIKRLAITAKQAYELGIYDKDKIMRDIERIVNKLHKLNIIHKDLHGDNYMYDDSGKLYIIDLGLAIEASYNNIQYNYLRSQDHKKFSKTLR